MTRVPPKTALVTGGAKRIGRAIVEDLAANGFAVAVHANSSTDEARVLAKTLSGEGGKATAVGGDLSSGQAITRLMAEARDALGPIGLLVNNASVFIDDSPEHFDEAVFDRHFVVHVKAPLRLAELFSAGLARDQEGLIVNIIDQRVWALTPRFFSYTLSKSALWTATRTMAQALAPRIRVNAIGPGPTLANERQSTTDFSKQVDRVPLKSGPELNEFGRTIRYLFDTPSITGQMIALDGGQHLAWETPDVADITE